MMYKLISEEKEIWNLSRACSSVGVSRSGYMEWLSKPYSLEPFEMAVRDEMQKIAVVFTRYGYRRMTIELQRRGFNINHKKVLNLMREDNLLCVVKRFKPVTTDSNHSFPVYPNLAKDIVVTAPNQLWVADITYIRLLNEFVYLAVIIDVFSRKCIGWCLDRSIDAQLTLNALGMALSNRKGIDLTGLIHHSDQGVQYASTEYVNKLKESGITISMSRKGNPYDNAFAESFIKTLKYEEVYLNEYESFIDALDNIEKFIDDVYNEKRLHSGIGYKTPNEVEKEVILNIRKT